jgi:hypothetical protein
MIQGLHDSFGLGVLPAKFISEGVLFLGNFAIQRSFVFREMKRRR